MPNPTDGTDWECVIGLEVHAQLRTQTKLFSSAPNQFGAVPNSSTTEVDLGMPGALPVINGRAVELAVRTAVALGCDVHPISRFARKHYFYPDLPKGYQISQYDEPYCTGGAVPVEIDGQLAPVALTRIHMEEDAAKSIHDDAITGPGVTHVDLNRAGVPLIEIVSEPDLRSPAEAAAYLRSLRAILRYLDVSDADMEKGHFRCDANVSIRKRGDDRLGVKVELKNINSFRYVERALDYEIERQMDVLESGGEIPQETRHWDERSGTTTPSREKENAEDYRYFPDPDLVPLQISDDFVARIRADLPELPHRKRARYESELGLSHQDAETLTEDRGVAEFFEATNAQAGNPKLVANWIQRSLLETLAQRGGTVEDLPVTPTHLAALLDLLEAGRITQSSARTVFAEMAKTGRNPADLVAELGLEAVSDTADLEPIARSVVEAHPEQVEQFRAGEQKVLNFLLGKVMRETQGRADPGAVREVLLRLLG